MRHIELLNLLCKNKELIDKIYQNRNNHDFFVAVEEYLKTSGIVREVSGSVKLNRHYIEFVNSATEKSSLAVVFESYEEELDECVRFAGLYRENANDYYITILADYIDLVHAKIDKRDKEIRELIFRLANEFSIGIDRLIAEISYRLEKVKTLLAATRKVSAIFSSVLLDLHPKLDAIVKNELYLLEGYLENIENYCDELSTLIRISEIKKNQNKKLSVLAARLASEDDFEFRTLLSRQSGRFAHTLNERFLIYPTPRDMHKIAYRLKEFIRLSRRVKRQREVLFEEPLQEELVYADIYEIIGELGRTGSEDLYKSVRSCGELLKFIDHDFDAEVFKNFLLITAMNFEEIEFEEDFNEYGIRKTRWIKR